MEAGRRMGASTGGRLVTYSPVPIVKVQVVALGHHQLSHRGQELHV